MEKQLLGVSLRSRQDFSLVKSYINVNGKSYSKPFQMLISYIEEYYNRDSDAEFVFPEVLASQVQEGIRNPKHYEVFATLIAEAVSTTHDVNVKAIILAAKQQEIGDRLAVALTNGSADVDELLAEYKTLRTATDLDELSGSDVEVYENVDLEMLMTQEFDTSKLIKLYPQSLSDKIGGGAKPGHHVVIYGRPESMKSGTAINMACGAARQGKKVVYFINEDRPADIIMRMVSNFTGMTTAQIRANPVMAKRKAMDEGFGNISTVSIAPGTIPQIAAYIDKAKPDVTVLDQLRNIKVRAENRTNQLESAANEARNIAKQYETLVLSVTQAGDSGSNKAVLDMGDIDGSNTGIPAQADLLLGVGVTEELEQEGLRMFSLPKNKLSGQHASFPVKVVPQLSRVLSV